MYEGNYTLNVIFNYTNIFLITHIYTYKYTHNSYK